jgi:hypothetical protein
MPAKRRGAASSRSHQQLCSAPTRARAHVHWVHCRLRNDLPLFQAENGMYVPVQNARRIEAGESESELVNICRKT